jgi:toxin ParE1/3/4
MTRRIIIRPEADADIEDAYRWYEKQRDGLGADFLLCVEDGLARIQRNPEMYPIVYKNVYRTLIRRFPYGIFYLIEKNSIVVLSVFHGRRDPKRWKSRS